MSVRTALDLLDTAFLQVNIKQLQLDLQITEDKFSNENFKISKKKQIFMLLSAIYLILTWTSSRSTN